MQALSELLSPSRSICRIEGGSKKRIFEEIAALVVRDCPGLQAADIIASLLAREKLGSTGLGQGIAIPHCRLDACEHPVGALLSLATPTADFDAPDDQPVDLLFALMVPQAAEQAHLDILATIARLFSQPALCQKLRACSSDEELYTTAVNWPL